MKQYTWEELPEKLRILVSTQLPHSSGDMRLAFANEIIHAMDDLIWDAYQRGCKATEDRFNKKGHYL